MNGNKTVDTNQCKPETLLYTSDECNKHPCGEGNKICSLLSVCDKLILSQSQTNLCLSRIDQIMPVDSKKPIAEESILEEECEDEMITVTPFSIEPDNEVTLFLFYNDVI